MRWLIAQFTIPGAPMSKQRPRHAAGRTYTPKPTLDAENKVAWIFRGAKKSFPTPIKEGVLRLEVDAYLPDKRPKDWDNVGKLVSDALNGLAYRDDSQIKEAEVRMFLDPANPRTEVRLYLLEEAG